jgi:hypothetical protein
MCAREDGLDHGTVKSWNTDYFRGAIERADGVLLGFTVDSLAHDHEATAIGVGSTVRFSSVRDRRDRQRFEARQVRLARRR